MDRLIRVFLEMLLLRKGPQDLPLAPFLLYLTLALHALSGFVLALAYQPPLAAFALGVADTALLGLVIWSLVVTGHVLRRALSAPLIVGVLIAIVFYWVAISVQDALFPLAE